MSFDRPSGTPAPTGRDKAVFDEQPLGPWSARVRVTPIKRDEGVVFEVYVAWTGPPAVGSPPSEEPVEAVAQYELEDLDPALAIANWAAGDLRGGRVPDLADIADQLGLGRY